MGKPLIAKNKAKALSTSLLLVGIAIMIFHGSWWPGMMIVIGIPLALKQFLTGRSYEAAITLFVFGGLFFMSAQFNIPWKILVPVLFIMGAVYILCKEWVNNSLNEDEGSEDPK